MKVNAISADYSGLRTRNYKAGVNTPPQPTETLSPGMMQISFKGGNKGDVLHIIAEVEPSFKKGGVATVGKDYKTLNNISPNDHGRTVIFTPYYNGNITYDKNSGELIEKVDVLRVPQNLPAGHPLKGKEGTPFFTAEDLSQISIDELLSNENNKNKFILLEEVSERKMSWGLMDETPIKLYKIPNDRAGAPAGTDIYLVYTDATASMRVPYQGGGYATTKDIFAKSWNGDPYAQFDKACVELMKDIDKKTPGFDPGTVICSDSHAAYAPHYMALKNAAGDEYFKGKKPTQVGHNLGNGYIGATSPRNMIVNLGATKEELTALRNSKEYIEALTNGEEDKFLIKFLQNITSEKKQTVSAIDIPVYYGLKGYLPMLSTVSEGYYEATIANPEIAPSLHPYLVKLDQQGQYIGLTNALNDEGTTAFKPLGLAGYGKEQKVKLANGKDTVVKPFEVFNKDKSTDLKYVREIKRKNKINLIQRFQPEYDGVKFYDNKGKLSTAKQGENLLRAGNDNKNHEVIGGFSPEYIKKLEKGEDVKLAVSWGRGDFQKALDTVVDGFEKYVNKTGDKNTLLILGGELSTSPEEGEKVKNKVKLLSEKEQFKGRIILMDGFAPGLPFSSAADISIFPSRFAPCELTDLEAKHMLCTPIVTNSQGLAQKNFDPDIASEAAMADGFKTKHDFYMTVDECLKVAQPKAKEDFEKVSNKIKNEESTKYKLRTGKDISPETLIERLNNNDKYQNALRELRDSVISDELAECCERALDKYRTGEVAERMLKNQVNIDTTWENNGWLSKTKLSAAELYRQKHIGATAKDISKNDLLKFDFSSLTPFDGGSRKGGKLFHMSKQAKIITGVAAGLLALGGLGYTGHKKGWFSSKYEEEKTKNNLSTVG